MSSRPGQVLLAAATVLALLVAGAAVKPAPVAAATTFTVNRIGDAADLNLANTKCDTSSASGNQCTLRAAIQEANDTVGADTINFNISGSSKVIRPNSPLPPITGALTIDAYSQPGTNVNTLAVGNNAVLKIVIDGINAGADAIGLDVQTGKTIISGLVIQRWSEAGVRLSLGKNLLIGNFIGTNVAGGAARGNGIGVLVDGVEHIIGGSGPAARNLISGNDSGGVRFTSASEVLVAGNYIGTNAAGTAALGNGNSGLFFVGGSDNVIGSGDFGAPNVISGNEQRGITFEGTSNSQVLGNLIGTNAAGTAAMGNGQDGIFLTDSDFNTIGGNDAADRNTISDNQTGIQLNNSNSNTIAGNRIGTRADGTGNLGNGFGGIVLIGNDNQIGGASGAGNVIANSKNNSTGVSILSGPSTGTLIQSNSITGNQGWGVRVEGAQTQIIGNAIVGNGKDGIELGAFNVSPVGVRMSANVIIGNGGIAIDLLTLPESATGVTPNDAGDGDSGSNRRQNFPVLSSAVRLSNGITLVSGSLNSTAETEFRIELYLAAPDASGHGEPQVLFGAQTITTNGSGNRSFTFQLGGLTPGMQLTSLAINEATDDTSELSLNQVVVQAP